eukprot:CAMPEP_0172521800 /NCGR_PEP_ID=MMETSP1066-20121228/292786_1 /TAXON_ID=671091 /ORGANISM="Coscinodiscus wailesii, Strain CCMP2513" /LENGTH=243 /DNA_ID=CAMNT_0013304759 /DNA_START=271 /DNA_END=1002 /DNA_ORIENTATION=-
MKLFQPHTIINPNTSPLPKDTIAIVTDAEYATCDGVIAPRSYCYLLAVAAGLEIRDVAYLSPSKTTDDENVGNKTAVIADSQSTNWGGPQRAVSARQPRGAEKDGASPPSSLLLHKFVVCLWGEFDSFSRRQRRGGGGRLSNSSFWEEEPLVYTKERLVRLLSYCGATVCDVPKSFKDDDKVDKIVLIRCKANSRDFRLAQKFWTQGVVVSADWLLDSIGDYEVKAFDDYMACRNSVGGKKGR